MGVAGAGKSLIGASFAAVVGLEFVEGDDFHPAKNIELMSRGVALTDDDRAEWLRALALRLRTADEAGVGVVIACSALKRAYRDVLRTDTPDVQFIYLRGSRELIAQRMDNRSGHCMPASLLDSQFAALEEPAPEENAWVIDINRSPAQIIAELGSRSFR